MTKYSHKYFLSPSSFYLTIISKGRKLCSIQPGQDCFLQYIFWYLVLNVTRDWAYIASHGRTFYTVIISSSSIYYLYDNSAQRLLQLYSRVRLGAVCTHSKRQVLARRAYKGWEGQRSEMKYPRSPSQAALVQTTDLRQLQRFQKPVCVLH